MNGSRRSSRARFAIIAACVVTLQLFAASSLSAQIASGDITGQVIDSSGAALPSATVTATNTANGLTRSVSSEDGGLYRLSGLRRILTEST